MCYLSALIFHIIMLAVSSSSLPLHLLKSYEQYSNTKLLSDKTGESNERPNTEIFKSKLKL